MLKFSRSFLVLALSFVFVFATLAQEAPKPGAEHQRLKALEGTWDATIKAGPNESKGTATYKMELGGLWLTTDFQGEIEGAKFTGRGFDGYDAQKKKYVGIWVDSMATLPVISEGTFDKDGKVLTMVGEGPGPDGKPMKYKMTTVYKDKDTMHWTMFGPGADGKDAEMFSITYKRRK